ncbi:DUF58 domain-containing protein [Adhaeribacter soli]|uniref:DUF58 domain-containing protein n=1 Tax=Adhaeribacter soli TaxID=2607655 RepID=A0A5N1J537_9BACT|nr:DUF58 domain-containing protein [Adhaeribacter soli]KAA9346026.1 DUF58 domain-containing protein [Adhaeribacter soli]
MKELLKKLQKFELRIRKVIDTQMQGDFHSVFKGTGLEFDDVRAYQYGDDVRSIDWNVSAKGHGTFIKTYKEEKEQSVFLILDVSGSQNIGPEKQRKLDIGKEICGILALTAVRQSAQLGLICISDQKEKYVRPGKGISHAYAIIKTLYDLKPQSSRTNLAAGIKTALSIIKRRSMLLLISDFIDRNYEKEVAMLARKHDLIVVQLMDQREQQFPSLGIIPIRDAESGLVSWVNTSALSFREKYLHDLEANREKLQQICRRNKADYLAIDTSGDYVLQLVNLFQLRRKTRKSA